MGYGKKKPVANTSTKKGTLPVFSLSIALDEGLKKLTGLFENRSKAGNTYWSGKDEEGNRFYLYPSDNDKIAFSLSVKANGSEEMEKLTGLFENTSKAGTTYWSGKTKDDDRFMLFRNEPK